MKFSLIQKTCGWPAVYRQMSEQFGKADADELFQYATGINEKYRTKYNGVKGVKRTHIMSAVAVGALYLPLREKVGSENAIQMMAEAAKPLAAAKHRKIEKLPDGLFMIVADWITTKMFSEKAGFQRRWRSNTSLEKSYDLLTCPYVDVLNDMECPEVCPAICIQDDYSFSHMKNGVLFDRKKTLGRGDDCCDFCFRIAKEEK